MIDNVHTGYIIVALFFTYSRTYLPLSVTNFSLNKKLISPLQERQNLRSHPIFLVSQHHLLRCLKKKVFHIYKKITHPVSTLDNLCPQEMIC